MKNAEVYANMGLVGSYLEAIFTCQTTLEKERGSINQLETL